MTLSGTEVPPQRRTSALGRQATAVLVAACLVVLAPGLDAYSAFAAGFQKGPSGPSQIPTLTLPTAPTIPGAAAPGAAIPNLAVPQLPGSALNLPAAAAPLPGIAGPSAPAALPRAAAANPLIPGAAAPSAAAPNAKPTTTEGILRAGAEQISAAQSAKSESGVSQALESMFTGGKAAAASFGDAVSGSRSAGPAPLAPLPLDELKTIARDSKKTDADRQAAVKAIADRSTDASKLALEEIGTERGGGPADYEIKRLALRRLADQGKVVSLPPVSDEHAAAILEKLSKEKPEVAAFDYDGTLEKKGAPASAETGAALKALADSGVQTMILTDRSENGRREGDIGILESLSTLAPAQRAAISVGANRGARIVAFDAAGAPRTVEQAAAWTGAERALIAAAAAKMAEKFGRSRQSDGTTELWTDYDYAAFLPANSNLDKIQDAARFLREELASQGLAASVVPRPGQDSETPYVTVTKYEKSLGASRLRALRETLDRLRDAERLPKSLRPLARALLAKLPSKAVPAASALLVGDHFFGPRGVDAGMVQGAPGALAISVGGTADPRLDNAFVWNKQGREGSLELMRAASGPAAPQMEGMNWKAFGGLFGSRTASIVAFLGTTLAYAKVAIGSVGPTHFGTLAALGGLVSIAAGPLTGKIADKFSARTGMALNAVLRAVFLLDLPLFTAFGILNFWTLLLGSIANGWLLSSIMTTEGAYLRRLFGFKNLRTANSLLQLNYFFLQIVFGLVLGIGGWVDGHNPMIPFYIASGVNAFVVLPIIWKTMPATAPVQTAAAPAAGAAAAARPSVLAGAASFLKTYWKEALILVASLASFPVLHSALPIAGALVWWVARTPGFKAIKADKPIISAVAMVSLGAFLFYGLQSYLLPTIATTLVGKAGSSLMLGKMLGAVFLGQMLSSSSMAKLPVIRLPFVGRFGLQRLVQAAVIGVTGLWVYTGLFPGSVLAAAAFMAVASALIFAAHYLTDKGWIGMIGAGMGFLALPALFWGNIPVLLGSLAVFGFFYGPASVALSAYVQRRADPAKIGQIMGIQGSLFNAAISLGIGSVSLIAGLMSPMFPATLAIVAGLAAVIGAVYFLGSKKLPGLPAKSFQTNEEVKK
jgi:hypothetical protein